MSTLNPKPNTLKQPLRVDFPQQLSGAFFQAVLDPKHDSSNRGVEDQHAAWGLGFRV